MRKNLQILGIIFDGLRVYHITVSTTSVRGGSGGVVLWGFTAIYIMRATAASIQGVTPR